VLFASLSAEPDDASALRLVGQSYIALDSSIKSSTDAIAAVKRSLALEPDNAHAFRILAIAYSRLRQHPLARQAALAAMRVEPNQWQSYAALAEADAAAKQISRETTDAVATAQSLAPSNPEVHFVAGRVAGAQGNARLAAQSYQQALALNPDHAGARNNLALIHMRRGNTGSAAASFVGLLSQNPNSRLALFNLRIAALRGLRIISLVLWIAVATVNSVSLSDPNSRSHTLTIVMGVLAVAVIAGYVLWVRSRAGRAFWPFVRSIPRTDRILSAWAAFLAVTIVALVVAIFVPLGATRVIYTTAEVGLFAGIVIMWFVSATLKPPASH
jgi:Flp pilus assembly protein TadD